jgi:hypothetical protein
VGAIADCIWESFWLIAIVVQWNATLNGYDQWLSIKGKMVSELHIGESGKVKVYPQKCISTNIRLQSDGKSEELLY